MANRVEGDSWQNLANAIVKQAADDYRADLKKIPKLKAKLEKMEREPVPEDENEMKKWERKLQNARDSVQRTVDDALSIERFCHSGWYGVLTGIDGDYLIRRLREEVLQK